MRRQRAMSLFGVQKFMYVLKKDRALQQAFRQDASAALGAFALSRQEHDALAAGDLASLYRMGVHPLLLAPYSRFMAIPRPAYQAALDPLRGLRTLRS
ncbi:MAG: hypothetical protein EXR27_16070 [Betaproteobacteria bacterium]|nr:hypothetical protein [Betaproteobacteria bacterium]